MKSLKQTNKKRKIIFGIIAIIILAAIALSVYIFAFNGSIFGWPDRKEEQKEKNINYKPPTKEQIAAGEQAKKETIEKADNPSSNNDDSLSVIITAANQNNPNLQVRVLIDAITTNEGSCQLTLVKDGKTVTKTAGLQALASTTTCKGFDVPTSELSPGSWNLTISVTSGSKTGKISKIVDIN